MSGALNQQLLRLAGVLQLARRAREVARDELGFVIVNETIQAVAYDQAALWDARRGRVVALSGVTRPEPGAPYVAFLRRISRRLATRPAGVVTPEPAETADWREFLAPETVWQPLSVRGQVVAGLLLARRDAWGEGDLQLLDMLAGGYAQSWELARARPAPLRHGLARRTRQALLTIAVLALLAAGALPVPSSTIAPAEVTPTLPAFVRAPFAGVIDGIAVAPNAPVHTGQVLVQLDRRQLDAQLRVAEKASEVAESQYRQTSQEAIADPRAREQLAVLRAKLDEARADLDYRRTLLARAAVVAPADGIAVYNDPADWIGRPVETGERIMLVAAPLSRRIEIELAVPDAITLDVGARVLFFDNLNPDRPSAARLTRVSYTTSMSVSGVLVYTCDAELTDGPGLRLGLKGSAKLYGPERPLALWLLRRPIAWLRELAG